MKRVSLTIMIALIITLALLIGGRSLGLITFNLPTGVTASEAAAPAPNVLAAETPQAPPGPVTSGQQIIADAHVAPIQRAGLSVATNGIVAAVLVREGERVQTGQPLLRLDSALAHAAVARAEADLQRSQANLDDLLAGTRVEDIAAAQANLDAAQARLEKLRQSTAAGDITASEASVANASANLQRVLEGPTEEQLIAAKAEAASAEAELQRAQRAYDQIKWRNDIGATKESADLQKATISYEAAKARLDDLQNGGSAADVNAASAQVRQANAQLQALKAARPSDIATLEADVRNAQAQLDKLLAGSTPTKLAAAEADVKAATASLQQQLISLGQTELRAPFAGIVAAVEINPGEQASPGVPLIQLADTSQWQIETEDLTELQVVEIQQGAQAMITFDALPDLELSAVIQSIRPFGENSSGDIVYKVILAPAQQDARLLWNMTAVVTFAGAEMAAASNAVAAVRNEN